MIRPMVGQPTATLIRKQSQAIQVPGRMSHSSPVAPRFGAEKKSGSGVSGFFKSIFTGNLWKNENIDTLSRWLDRNKTFIDQGDFRVLEKKTGDSRYDPKTYHIELGGEEYYIHRQEDAKVDWQIKYTITNVERNSKGDLLDDPMGELEYVMQRSCSSSGKNGNFVSFTHRGFACNIKESKNPTLIEKTEGLLEALSKVLDSAPNK